MDIVLQGQHTGEETVESLVSVLQMFKDRYHIQQFREIHLTLTLVDDEGVEVELIDNETSQVYRMFEVYRQGQELTPGRRINSFLKLVVDNTRDDVS